MSVQITIIGMGQIGASIGLGLAGVKEIYRVGHDRELSITRKAKKMGALDKVDYNLPNSVKNADVVVLALPADQVRETPEFIPPDLKPGAVVLDTAPAKQAVPDWAAACLPEGRHYIGLLPALNARYLHEQVSGLESAHADLFQGSVMAIVAPPRAAAEAVQLAVDLAGLLGTTPFFADPLELDGLIAAVHVLPQLLSAALVNASTGQPGWGDARKVAGRAYAAVTAPLAWLDGPPALAAQALHNPHNVVRLIDGAVAALQALRQDIESGNSAGLQARLESVYQARQAWWSQRQAAAWADEDASSPRLPAASESISRLFWVNRKKK